MPECFRHSSRAVTMTADTDNSRVEENPADTNDSVAYKPEHRDREYTDIGAALEIMSLNEVGLGVDKYPHEGDDGVVSLHLRDSMISGKLFFDPDQAEWLADRLAAEAKALRQTE